MDGNSHAHNMETESMEDWTKQADIDADQRCPDKCTLPGCTRVATSAFALFFWHVWLEDEHGHRVRRLHGTPWQYCCDGCAEIMTFDDLADEDHRSVLEDMADVLRGA